MLHIDKCIEVTQNISDYWKHGSIENKIRIQKLVFPSGIVIDPKKREYRTTKVNSIFTLISCITMGKGAKTKNASSKLDDASRSVERTEKMSNQLLSELEKFSSLIIT